VTGIPSTSNGTTRGPGTGYVGRIPVRNLWLLLLYASDLFRETGSSDVSREENPDRLPDLLGEILAHAVEQRLRRQLSLGYRERRLVLHRVRGRVDLLRTERRKLLDRGLVACRFHELTMDTQRNRFVLAALSSVARRVRDRRLAHRCREVAGRLRRLGVSTVPPDARPLGSGQYGRHDTYDRYMLAAAKLALDLALPAESAGVHALPRPSREEEWARRLFEKAVGGFYRVVLAPRGWRVRTGRRLNWPCEEATSGIERILPTMKTDIVIDRASPRARIVIDTKFTSITEKGYRRDETLKRDHLFQIYAYLRSQVGLGRALDDRAEGLVLYPSVGADVDESVHIQGHRIRFATVDLTASPTAIRRRLLKVTEPPIPESSIRSTESARSSDSTGSPTNPL